MEKIAYFVEKSLKASGKLDLQGSLFYLLCLCVRVCACIDFFKKATNIFAERRLVWLRAQTPSTRCVCKPRICPAGMCDLRQVSPNLSVPISAAARWK